MFGVRKAPTGCNFVHNDEIWKDHVHRELQTSRRWPDTWGFLAAHYQGKAADGSNHTHQTQRQRAPTTSSPTGSGDVRLPPINQTIPQDHPQTSRQQQQSNSCGTTGKEVGLTSQPLVGLPSLCYPRTTAREVGWRSGDIGRLEKYGRHARGQKGIRKLLNWPREAIL